MQSNDSTTDDQLWWTENETVKIDIKIDDPRNRTNDLPDKMFSMLAVYMLRQSDVPLFSSFSMKIHLVIRFAIG